jgi:ribosomal protein S18 acetylase RimI-like enzyme
VRRCGVVDIVLRDATHDDVDAVLELWAHEAHGRSISDDPVSVRALVDHPTSSCLVAVADGRIVGSVLIGWDGWRFSLYRLAVAGTHRRLGIGGRLIEEAIRRAPVVGATRLDAMVAEGNEDAAPFWSAIGFRPNPRYRRWERRL